MPEAELVTLPGFLHDIAASRAEARRLLAEAGVPNLSSLPSRRSRRRLTQRNPTRTPSLAEAYIDLDPLISASRGTLAGDLLWLGAIGFILAIITGMIG
jgi:hypothetical protein